MKVLPSLLCLGWLTLTQLSCTTDGKKAGPALTEKPAIDNEGVHIDYTDTGKGDTTLLFVHGWCINKTYWTSQEKFFSNQYRVITVDLPGFGASGKNRNDWSVEAYGRDIDTVMARLNLRNVLLIGHSMAGDIIVEAAVNDPGRVLALVGIDNFKNFAEVPGAVAKKSYANAITALKHNFKKVATNYFNQALFSPATDSAVRKRVLQDVYQSDSTIAIATMESNEYDEVRKLVAAKKKLYLINSDVTPTATSGFQSNKIPYEVLSIHGTGHYPMIEKPQEFNTLLSQVIAKTEMNQR